MTMLVEARSSQTKNLIALVESLVHFGLVSSSEADFVLQVRMELKVIVNIVSEIFSWLFD